MSGFYGESPPLPVPTPVLGYKMLLLTSPKEQICSTKRARATQVRRTTELLKGAPLYAFLPSLTQAQIRFPDPPGWEIETALNFLERQLGLFWPESPSCGAVFSKPLLPSPRLPPPKRFFPPISVRGLFLIDFSGPGDHRLSPFQPFCLSNRRSPSPPRTFQD